MVLLALSCGGSSGAVHTSRDAGAPDASVSPVDASDSGHATDAGDSGDAGSGGGDSGDETDDADAQADSATINPDIDCLTAPCDAGEVCCADPAASSIACSASCAPADVLGCLKPSDCGGDTPTCCVTDVRNGGTPPHCTAASVATRCTTTASCPSTVVPSCSTTAVVPLCTGATDCPTGQRCCQVTGAGMTFTVCVNGSLATLGNLTCD
jgi:hypothetical protein